MAKGTKKAAKPVDTNIMTSEDNELLSYIVSETSTKGYAYIDPKNSVVLVNNGYVELNDKVRNNLGVATRATTKGIELMSKTVETVKSAAMPVHTFAIAKFDKSLVTAKVNGRRGRTAKYPIDALEAGNFFFVPADEKTPDPVKSLVGTVQAANNKYSTDTDKTRVINRKDKTTGEIVAKTIPVKAYSRKFEVHAYEVNGAKGAAVVRTI